MVEMKFFLSPSEVRQLRSKQKVKIDGKEYIAGIGSNDKLVFVGKKYKTKKQKIKYEI